MTKDNYTFQDFLNSNVVTTVDTMTAPLSEVFFPSVVVCNINQVRAMQAQAFRYHVFDIGEHFGWVNSGKQVGQKAKRDEIIYFLRAKKLRPCWHLSCRFAILISTRCGTTPQGTLLFNCFLFTAYVQFQFVKMQPFSFSLKKQCSYT